MKLELIAIIEDEVSIIAEIADEVSIIAEIEAVAIACQDVIVSNSDDSFYVEVPSGDSLELLDITYDVYVNGVLNTSGSLPAQVDNIINIT